MHILNSNVIISRKNYGFDLKYCSNTAGKNAECYDSYG